MVDQESGHSRWAVYVTHPMREGWVLHGIYPTAAQADAHGKDFHPRMVVPISWLR